MSLRIPCIHTIADKGYRHHTWTIRQQAIPFLLLKTCNEVVSFSLCIASFPYDKAKGAVSSLSSKIEPTQTTISGVIRIIVTGTRTCTSFPSFWLFSVTFQLPLTTA